MGPRVPRGIRFGAGKKNCPPRAPTFYSLGPLAPPPKYFRNDFNFSLIPYTLLGGAPHPPDPPGLKIHEKLNFQKNSRPNFFVKSPGPLGLIN